VSLATPTTPRLEGDQEIVRREHEKAIRELQGLPAMQTRIIADVSLADATATPVAHGLGRAPRMLIVSPPRGPSTSGRIEEIRSSTYDRTKVIALKATGFGATVTVDIEVK
jgi:hypothetical protein